MYFQSAKMRLVCLCIFAATGCQSPQALAETMAPQQLIIKFRPNTITCDAAGIAHLSSVTGIPLEYVRPMSGDACVIRQRAGGAKELLQRQELLKEHSAVEWLEQDAKKKAL